MWEAALSSTERFEGTYCARGIDTDPGSLQEAQDNASPGGDTKGSKKDPCCAGGGDRALRGRPGE